ncbi:hypothetical protein EC957_009260 [Mortierella hygrophila]|uniref:Uncharacterized protein n=1 Tax=Mortierella hygrophila TaxID=979708 RepID=A0A9P6K8M3_9FUNG|nr:hypothetical protein EC957_009260 [Mortierella hygrophila]
MPTADGGHKNVKGLDESSPIVVGQARDKACVLAYRFIETVSTMGKRKLDAPTWHRSIKSFFPVVELDHGTGTLSSSPTTSSSTTLGQLPTSTSSAAPDLSASSSSSVQPVDGSPLSTIIRHSPPPGAFETSENVAWDQ